MGIVILNRQTLAEALQRHRLAGETIVSTNGVFDVLHVGHVRYLRGSRRLGDLLVVAVNTDACTARLKGPERPYVPEDERAEMLAALECVDYVTVFDEDTPAELLAVIRPNIHTKGGDYNVEEMPETRVVRANGGRVVVLAFEAGHSTTGLVDRLRNGPAPAARDAETR